MRLDKFLSDCGFGTRSQIKKDIKAGLVTVNGDRARKPEQQVDETADHICCRGQTCVYEKYVYYMLHKPAGVVSATKDASARTVLDQKKRLEQGVDIGDKALTKPAVVCILDEKKITLTITEGRFHQVKRMLHAVGNEVCYLKRLRMGALTLDRELPTGNFRRLTQEEVELLSK